jgi:LacI family transcriptional regulator
LIQLVAQGAPIVLVGRDAGSIPVSFVKADEDQGAYEATRHLLVRGLRPALIAVDEEHRSALADERVRGYERALRESGIPEGRTPRVHGDYSFASGYQLGCRVLAREPRPDSLFVLNEVMAAGAMLAAQELGFRVPEDLAIATTENSPMVNYVRPRLSAVHVPMFDVAARATEMLFSLLDGSASGTLQQVVPTTFVPRESSLCPASVPTGAAP